MYAWRFVKSEVSPSAGSHISWPARSHSAAHCRSCPNRVYHRDRSSDPAFPAVLPFPTVPAVLPFTSFQFVVSGPLSHLHRGMRMECKARGCSLATSSGITLSNTVEQPGIAHSSHRSPVKRPMIRPQDSFGNANGTSFACTFLLVVVCGDGHAPSAEGNVPSE